MSKIDTLFENLRSSGQRAFMPFITAGDPDLAFTATLLKRLDDAGCHLVELGIPYSDPIADGSVIQQSYTRALNGGVRLEAIFEMLGGVIPELKMPVVTMVSYSIIHRVGIDRYPELAASCGIAGLIVPDLPVEEAASLEKRCGEFDLSLIHLVTPTTNPQRLKQIVERSTGFIYYVSVAGITGERTSLPDGIVNSMQQIRDLTSTPLCVGFGISSPAHVELLRPVADGMIVGSAIVKRIGTIGDGVDADSVINDVVDFSRQMIAAANPS